MDDETIKAKIAEVEKAIHDLQTNANQEMAFLNGKLVALRELLQPQEKPNEQTGTATPQT